jgi:hypothetical protein
VEARKGGNAFFRLWGFALVMDGFNFTGAKPAVFLMPNGTHDSFDLSILYNSALICFYAVQKVK